MGDDAVDRQLRARFAAADRRVDRDDDRRESARRLLFGLDVEQQDAVGAVDAPEPSG